MWSFVEIFLFFVFGCTANIEKALEVLYDRVKEGFYG